MKGAGAKNVSVYRSWDNKAKPEPWSETAAQLEQHSENVKPRVTGNNHIHTCAHSRYMRPKSQGHFQTLQSSLQLVCLTNTFFEYSVLAHTFLVSHIKLNK